MPKPVRAQDALPSDSIRWGKSSALNWLSTRLSSAQVPAGAVINGAEWDHDPVATLAGLSLPANMVLAVRSDAACEDQQAHSHAGRFLTQLNVEADGLPEAIARVLESQDVDAHPRILLQPMLRNLRRVGVASTHRISDGAPWYCVEFARGDSAAVTAGRATGRQLVWRRGGVGANQGVSGDADSQCIVNLLREIESHVPAQAFEIEFAFSIDCDLPHLLQVRPLAAAPRWPSVAVSDKRPQPSFGHDRLGDVVGTRAVYSLMSDWNPAELIGCHPRPLALGLFQALIARGTWWHARSALGYRACPTPVAGLLRPMAGRPYVDLRRSANSLLPAALDARLGHLLVDHWLAQVSARPELHDKVEFEVFASCRDLRPSARPIADYRSLLGDTGSRRFETALRRLTKPLMQIDPSALAPHLLACSAMSSIKAKPSGELGRRLRWARVAALEFAKLARIAFIAEAQLRSAIAMEALTPERALALRLAAGGLDVRMAACRQAAIHHATMRPSSFDITQPLWQAARLNSDEAGEPLVQSFALQPTESRALSQLLLECGLPMSAAQWAAWISTATQAREWGKLMLSQPLTALVECLAKAGAARELDRETLSWLTLTECRAAVTGKLAAVDVLTLSDCAQRRGLAESKQLMSPVLARRADLDRFDSLGTQPNFVGLVARQGPLRLLEHGHPEQHVERGSVVAVRHADPGYDWLFERGIGGLVTAWGGAHSHMGIRCSEHGLPAALGCGEAVWAQAQRASHARIDPAQAALWLY